MEAAVQLGRQLHNQALACTSLVVAQSTLYRYLAPKKERTLKPRPAPARALPPETRQEILDHLHAEEFIDRSPSEAFHTLLDRGVYYGSVRTYYRILNANDEVKDRRNHRRHVVHAKPELVATGPKQCWSWDITKLKGHGKFVYYHLYTIIDIYSRYVVGWLLAPREAGCLAEELIEATCRRQQIPRNQLTIHSDRGAAMQSAPVVNLLAQLDITKSNSRPHVSNDNPFIESFFSTAKAYPTFPERFGSLEDALSFCRQLFPWYNTLHCHSGIAYLTPETVHYGRADEVLEGRHQTMLQAYKQTPERFVRGAPKLKVLDHAVYINPPAAPKDTPLVKSSLN